MTVVTTRLNLLSPGRSGRSERSKQIPPSEAFSSMESGAHGRCTRSVHEEHFPRDESGIPGSAREELIRSFNPCHDEVAPTRSVRPLRRMTAADLVTSSKVSEESHGGDECRGTRKARRGCCRYPVTTGPFCPRVLGRGDGSS